MRITEKQLRKIIREQVEAMMGEQDETLYMEQAPEEVQAAVDVINSADALAKSWAKRNLKI